MARRHLLKDTRTDQLQAVQARQRAWVHALCQLSGLRPTPMTKAAGASGTTVTRLLNDPSYTGTLQAPTIERLKAHYRVVSPDEFASGMPLRIGGDFSQDAVTFDYRAAGVDTRTAAVVEQLLQGRPNASSKLLRSNAVAEAGYRIGDIVIAEDGIRPTNGDVVVADLRGDDDNSGRITLVRVYRSAGALGFLLPPADRQTEEAELVDGQRVRIVSVVTQAFRPQARVA